jgi:uncharacterized membrane protein YphA (DoxX/SURF4 family)
MASANAPGRALAVLRLCLGVFFIFEALGKIGWLMDPSPLVAQLTGWRQSAGPVGRGYLDAVALPGALVFARLVPLGEAAAGLALVFGVYTRAAAALAFLMVLNFHVASGALFKYAFLTNGYGLPVLGALLALAIGGASLPYSLKK